MVIANGKDTALGLTPEVKAEIDEMSHFRMAWLWRFAPVGSPYLIGEVGDYFVRRFLSLGGMTDDISKAIGWDDPNPKPDDGRYHS